MLYTRKGDEGTSGLFGTKERFPKENTVFEALGALDELSSLLGICFARSRKKEVRTAQQHLFVIQAELAGAQKCITAEHVRELEAMTDRLEAQIQHPHAFIVPGSTELSGWFDYARAVSRRTERAVLRARILRNLSPHTYAYLNRLSSLLYALARQTGAEAKTAEVSPSY